MVQTGSRRRRYFFAIALIAAAAALRLALQAWVDAPFLTFFAAVLATAWYWGFGPSILAIGLSSVAAYAVVPPERLAATASNPYGLVPRFVIASVVLAWLIDRLRRAQQLSAERLAVQLESARRAEDAQTRLAAIVESTGDAIISTTLDGILLSWNRGAERLYGFTSAEAIGAPISLMIPPDRMAEEQAVLSRIRNGELIDALETTRRRKDGSLIHVAITASPIRDASGVIVGTSKIARDITERRLADEMRADLLEREQRALADALAASDRLEFLAEVSAVLTSSLDYEATLDRAVHAALPRLGDFCNVLVQNDHGQLEHVAWAHVNVEKEPAVRRLAQGVVELADPSDVATFSRAVMKAAASIIVDHASLACTIAAARARAADPELLQITDLIAPHAYLGVPLLVRGRSIGVISFGSGANESRREYSAADLPLAEEFARRVSLAVENARLFRQAEDLNRLKDEFLATLSHELRTPLAAVLGWSRMLLTGQLDAEQSTHALQAIARNAQAQVQLVDDVLDVARGMAGRLHLNMQPIDLTAVAHRSVEAVAPAAAAKRIDVQVRAATPVPVVGDAGRLQQVVGNVLSNAVKFTHEGGRVTVDVTACDGAAQVEVTDNGAGIDRTFLPYVFDKFRQADGSFSRQHGGLGLGLAIARHLIELHSGSVEARSDGEGHGATFVIRLPTVNPPHPSSLSPTESPAQH
jgi:PAS domain S-box-containing protein